MCESGTLRPRPLSSTEIERRDSSGLDSGVGSPLVLTRRSSGISLAMKRVRLNMRDSTDCTLVVWWSCSVCLISEWIRLTSIYEIKHTGWKQLQYWVGTRCLFIIAVSVCHGVLQMLWMT